MPVGLLLFGSVLALVLPRSGGGGGDRGHTYLTCGGERDRRTGERRRERGERRGEKGSCCVVTREVSDTSDQPSAGTLQFSSFLPLPNNCRSALLIHVFTPAALKDWKGRFVPYRKLCDSTASLSVTLARHATRTYSCCPSREGACTDTYTHMVQEQRNRGEMHSPKREHVSVNTAWSRALLVE